MTAPTLSPSCVTLLDCGETLSAAPITPIAPTVVLTSCQPPTFAWRLPSGPDSCPDGDPSAELSSLPHPSPLLLSPLPYTSTPTCPLASPTDVHSFSFFDTCVDPPHDANTDDSVQYLAYYVLSPSTYSGFRPARVVTRRRQSLRHLQASDESTTERSCQAQGYNRGEVDDFWGVILIEGTKCEMHRSDWHRQAVSRGSRLRFELLWEELIADEIQNENDVMRRCRVERIDSTSSWAELEDEDLPADFASWD